MRAEPRTHSCVVLPTLIRRTPYLSEAGLRHRRIRRVPFLIGPRPLRGLRDSHFMRVLRLVSAESCFLQPPIDRLLIDINAGRVGAGTIFRRLFDRGGCSMHVQRQIRSAETVTGAVTRVQAGTARRATLRDLCALIRERTNIAGRQQELYVA